MNIGILGEEQTDSLDLGGYEEATPYGPVYVIDTPAHMAQPGHRPGPSAELYRSLHLVPGIGPHTAEKLKAAGFTDLPTLCAHQRFGPAARALVQAIEQGDLARLRLAGVRDFELLSFFHDSDLAVIDIETAGLHGWPVILIGIGRQEEGAWRVRQFFARGFEEEKALLHIAATTLSSFSGLVSYNGRAFDEPFVAARLAYHRLEKPCFLAHIDLYHEVRRKYRATLPDCRLVTAMRHLAGICRTDDIPGSEVPARYLEYMETGKSSSILPVLKHNADDVADLCLLFELMRVKGRHHAA